MLKTTRCFLLIVALLALTIVPPSGVNAADKTTIRFWTLLDLKDPGPRSEALRLIIAEFEKKNPNISVQAETVPWAQIDPQLIQAAAAGKTPDVTILSMSLLGQHVRARTILPLDEYVAKWSEAERNDFLVPLKYIQVNGKTWGIHLQGRASLLIYRDDYLKAKGLNVPKTWEELAEAGRKITSGSVLGFAWGLDPRARATALTEPLLSMFWSVGEEILDANGKATFNTANGAKVYQFINDLVHKHKAMDASVASYTYEDVFQGLKSGTIGMAFLGSHRVVAARAAGNLGERLKTAPLPGPDKPAPANFFGWTLAMGKDTKNKDAAWKFIDHMLGYESRLTEAKLAGEMPPRRSVYNDPWFKTPGATEMRSWAEYVGAGGKTFSYPEKYQRLSDFWAEGAQEMVLKKASPAQILDQAAKKYNALVQ